MRLRNIPRAESVLCDCQEVVKNASGHRGHWKNVFENSHPIHIEIGMGKGKFLLSLARQNPGINYIGIERYSSVLLRAVEKYTEPAGSSDQILKEIPLQQIGEKQAVKQQTPGLQNQNDDAELFGGDGCESCQKADQIIRSHRKKDGGDQEPEKTLLLCPVKILIIGCLGYMTADK